MFPYCSRDSGEVFSAVPGGQIDALYFRVSSDRQTAENQFEDLLQIVEKTTRLRAELEPDPASPHELRP